MNFQNGYSDKKTRLLRLLIVLWLWMFASHRSTWIHNKNLVDNGIATVGTVTSQEQEADTYHYYYEFTDQHGQPRNGHAGAYANTYSVGSQVPVKYLAENPKISCVEPVRREKMFYDQQLFIVESVVLLVLLGFVLWLVPHAV